MYGTQIGTLRVISMSPSNVETELWSESGSHGFQWLYKSITLQTLPDSKVSVQDKFWVFWFFFLQWLAVRSECSFCWYWWNCLPSQFKLLFHNCIQKVIFDTDHFHLKCFFCLSQSWNSGYWLKLIWWE